LIIQAVQRFLNGASLSAGTKKQSDEKSRNPMISGLLLFRGIAEKSKKTGF
jgi:hypothetical protein